MGHRGTLVAVVGSLLLVASGALASSQDWTLEEEDHPSLSNNELIMARGGGFDDVGSILVDPGDCQTWAAMENTRTDVEFPAGTWSGQISAEGGTADTSLDYEVNLGFTTNGSWAATATYTYDASVDGTHTGSFNIDAPSFTVPDDEYLLVQVCVPAGASSSLEILTDGSSVLVSPSGSPSYPTPEIGAIGLTLAGFGAVLAVGRLNRSEGDV